MEGNLVPPANALNDVEEQHLNAENNQIHLVHLLIMLNPLPVPFEEAVPAAPYVDNEILAQHQEAESTTKLKRKCRKRHSSTSRHRFSGSKKSSRINDREEPVNMSVAREEEEDENRPNEDTC